jgi:hypothetical protein
LAAAGASAALLCWNSPNSRLLSPSRPAYSPSCSSASSGSATFRFPSSHSCAIRCTSCASAWTFASTSHRPSFLPLEVLRLARPRLRPRPGPSSFLPPPAAPALPAPAPAAVPQATQAAAAARQATLIATATGPFALPPAVPAPPTPVPAAVPQAAQVDQAAAIAL